jgi:threonine dehydratase
VRRPVVRDVYRARQALAPLVRRTPLVRSRWFSAQSDAIVWLKLESWQRTGSFKIRGALWAVSELRAAVARHAADHHAPMPPRVVTASAGNHGLALADAAVSGGLRATIFTPAAAPRSKLDAIAGFDVDLRPIAENYDEAERLALEYAAAEGATYISPYNHPHVIAGAGTVGIEILEDAPDLDIVLVPVGGGGLVSGVATAVKALSPSTRVVGVEAALNPAFTTALAAGRITKIPVRPTIADGLGGNIEPGSLTFDIVRDMVDEIVTVGEDDLRSAIRELLAREHVVAEGAGVPAIAALRTGKVAVAGRTVAALVTGANIDLETLREVLGR